MPKVDARDTRPYTDPPSSRNPFLQRRTVALRVGATRTALRPVFPAKTPRAADFIDPRDWADLPSKAYADNMPPVAVTRPALWTPRLDECDRFLTEEKRHSMCDEYRHLLCSGVFYRCRALGDRRRYGNASCGRSHPQARADADYLLDSVLRTLKTIAAAGEDRLTYTRRFKGKKALTGDENTVAERLVYRRFFDTAVADRGANGVDGLLAALDDKRLEAGVAPAAAPTLGPSRKDARKARERKKREEADRKKAAKLHTDRPSLPRARASPLPRVRLPVGLRVDTGSRAFLVPTLGGKWRFIIDLRHLNSCCVRERIRMETLMGLMHLTIKSGDFMFSFDLKDGFYALGIAEADRDYFTVDIRGALCRLAGLPMGSSLSPYYFTTFTERHRRHTRWRGARILPYVDDFLLFADTEAATLGVRASLLRVQGRARTRVLDALGLERHAEKVFWEPSPFSHHLGINIDSAAGLFYAPEAKLLKLAGHAKPLLSRVTRNARWLPWSTTAVPTHANGKPIQRPLKDVRLAVESFLPRLAGRNVLMHEDNHAVVHFLTTMTSRSPATLMAELLRLWCLLVSHDIRLRARYIRSAANVWADRLSRHLDSDDRQFDPVLFAEPDARFGPHTIDRSAASAGWLAGEVWASSSAVVAVVRCRGWMGCSGGVFRCCSALVDGCSGIGDRSSFLYHVLEPRGVSRVLGST
eukprot:jgi/Tetstr1/428109/TSEL_018164.t1